MAGERAPTLTQRKLQRPSQEKQASEELSPERLAELEAMAAAIHLEVTGKCPPQAPLQHRVYGPVSGEEEAAGPALLSTEWACSQRLGRFRVTESTPRFTGPQADPGQDAETETVQQFCWVEGPRAEGMAEPAMWHMPMPMPQEGAPQPRLLGSAGHVRASAGDIVPGGLPLAAPPSAPVPAGARLAAKKASGAAAELDLLGRYGMDMHWGLHQAAAHGAQLGHLTASDLALADKLAGILAGQAAEKWKATGREVPVTGRKLVSGPPPGVFLTAGAPMAAHVGKEAAAGPAPLPAAAKEPRQPASEGAATASAAPSESSGESPEAASAAESEEEAPEAVRPGQLGSAELPSKGSAGHAHGACKPCAFMFKGGCQTGVACSFCHLCEQGEKKRRKKERQQVAKLRRAALSMHVR